MIYNLERSYALPEALSDNWLDIHVFKKSKSPFSLEENFKMTFPEIDMNTDMNTWENTYVFAKDNNRPILKRTYAVPYPIVYY